jgi:tight adherence protein B
VIDFIQAFAAELRSGQAPALAWSSLWPAAGFGDDDSSGGQEPAAAMRSVATRPGNHGLARMAACWEVAEHSGAGLVEALDRVARALQSDREVAAEIESQLAGSRATARLLAVLPVLALVMGEALGADPLQVLLTTGYGWACLVMGGGLSLLGSRWIERQVRSVTPWSDP